MKRQEMNYTTYQTNPNHCNRILIDFHKNLIWNLVLSESPILIEKKVSCRVIRDFVQPENGLKFQTVSE